MIYADFESILGAEDNGKQNPNESNTSKYQKHVACSYGNKLVCVEGKFSKPFKSYLTEDPVDNFINSTIDKSKYCSDVMKKHFKKDLLMTKEDNENFENATKCWICDNNFNDNDVKIRYHFHITGNYAGSAHRFCNINVKLNHKIPAVFHNLKKYDSILFIQELGKFNLKIKVISNGLEKNKLIFIDSFQIPSSSLNSSLKNFDKDDLKFQR